MLPRKQRPKEAAKRYGVGLSTLWRYIRDGKLKAVNISPNVTVLDTEDLEKFFSGEA